MTDRELLESLVQKVTSMESGLQEVKAGQLRMENKFDEKIGALSDAFETCNDRIDKLQEHLDDRLDTIQTDVNYLIGKTAQQDQRFIDLKRKVVR